MTVLSPFVYWAQNELTIFLKIDLNNVQEPNIKFESNKLHFQAKGIGAQGLNNYTFTLDFNDKINTKMNNVKINDNRVEISVNKSKKAWWPRLIIQDRKPAWLKVDYDRFENEDTKNDDEQMNDIRKIYPDLYEQLKKEEFGYKKEDLKIVYLTIYNLLMFVGFVYVIILLIVRCLKDGIHSLPATYDALSPALELLQTIQCIETVHHLFGLVGGGVLASFLQTFGRCFMLFVTLKSDWRLQKSSIIFPMFLVWSLIELFRYSYYTLQLRGKHVYLITWMRYNAWIILYPIGLNCEGLITFYAIDYLNDQLIFIPFTNYGVSLKLFLNILLFSVGLPVSYLLLSYMYKARKIKFGGKKIKSS